MPVVVDSIPQPPGRVKEYWADRPMGEVRVQVRLANSAEVYLAQQGKLKDEDVRTYDADAMVDTGSACTVIPQNVADALGLTPFFKRSSVFANGQKADVDVTGPLLVEIMGRETIEEALILGDEVLIGQTVLEKTDLLVDCAHGGSSEILLTPTSRSSKSKATDSIHPKRNDKHHACSL